MLRGRQKFDKQGYCYFITTTLFNYERIFSLDERYNMIIIDSLKFLMIEHQAELYAYVIMPTHIHLLLRLGLKESIIDFMRDFKRYTSKEIKLLLKKDNKTEILKRLNSYSRGYKNQKSKLWMDRYDDVMVSTERVFNIKMNYIHFNPVKSGLVDNMEDWRFSSYRNYIYNDHSIIKITIYER
ncbi:MAG: REP-associated tyrosine transposase [Ignavibacteria bacterium]